MPSPRLRGTSASQRARPDWPRRRPASQQRRRRISRSPAQTTVRSRAGTGVGNGQWVRLRLTSSDEIIGTACPPCPLLYCPVHVYTHPTTHHPLTVPSHYTTTHLVRCCNRPATNSSHPPPPKKKGRCMGLYWPVRSSRACRARDNPPSSPPRHCTPAGHAATRIRPASLTHASVSQSRCHARCSIHTTLLTRRRSRLPSALQLQTHESRRSTGRRRRRSAFRVPQIAAWLPPSAAFICCPSYPSHPHPCSLSACLPFCPCPSLTLS